MMAQCLIIGWGALGWHWLGHWVGHGGRGQQILVRQVGNCNNTIVIEHPTPASPLQSHVLPMLFQ
ncbi:MAG: hypothetical protein ACPGWR_04945 [Ardenticatenaceae bacterium]